MKRFVPNFSCEDPKYSGIAAIKTLMGYKEKVNIYEKKIFNIDSAPKGIIDARIKMPTTYDIIKLSRYNCKIVADEEIVESPIADILKEKRKEVENKIEEKIVENIEQELLNVLKKRPVMAFVNFSKLYEDKMAGIGWIVVVEYNPKRDEIITYDPMFFKRVAKTDNWERLENTPKKRYIAFKRRYFFKKWKEVKEIKILFKKKTFKPFRREFIYLI